MSLKFAAVGNLMALSAFENRARVEDRFNTLSPIETYDPLLAMIGRSRRAEPTKPKSEEKTANQARW
jgi:hypothetical protein